MQVTVMQGIAMYCFTLQWSWCSAMNRWYGTTFDCDAIQCIVYITVICNSAGLLRIRMLFCRVHWMEYKVVQLKKRTLWSTDNYCIVPKCSALLRLLLNNVMRLAANCSAMNHWCCCWPSLALIVGGVDPLIATLANCRWYICRQCV